MTHTHTKNRQFLRNESPSGEKKTIQIMNCVDTKRKYAGIK